jgi:hypothetical protein
MTTTTDDLWIAGRSMLGSPFIGVFPLDKLPPLSSIVSGNSFIVNTQSSNLPGMHWLAVFVTQSQMRVFDPLGASSYPNQLVDYLHRNNERRVFYNRRVIQDPRTSLCGQHCLRWLKGKKCMFV